MVNKKISVVIPCYNEEKNILNMHKRLTKVLKSAVADYELIFVDDYSTDNSRGMLRKLSKEDSHVVSIFFSRNFGYSDIAYSAGTEHATGDAVVWIDGDIQDPPELIKDFIEMWQEGYDVVYGIRKERKGNILLRIGAKGFYRLFNKLSYVRMPVDAGDFSLLDRKVVDVLNKMPERDRFIRGLRAWVGFRQTGIPYVRDERSAGTTTQGLTRYFYAARKGIFTFSYKPLSLITYIAVLSFVLLILAAIFYFVLALFYPAPPGFLTLLMIVLFIGSLQFLILAILGEYIGRIFEEVKGRPKYVIEEVVGGKK